MNVHLLGYKLKSVVRFIPDVCRCTYLCLRFPFLRPNPETVLGYFTRRCWYYAIPYGWRKAFGIQLCKELKSAIKRDGCKFAFTDIKEKFGELTIYAVCGDEAQDILNKYEYISRHTCIECGRRAKYVTTGWICPYCEDCIEDFKKATAKEYYSDIPFYGWTNAKYNAENNKE